MSIMQDNTSIEIQSTVKTIFNISERLDNNTIIGNKDAGNDISESVLPWILGIYFGNIIMGLIFNSMSFIALLRTRKNGTMSIICQITGLDIASAGVCVIEILNLRYKSWIFPSELCPFYTGAELLINTATLYLIICLNYHTISLCNLQVPSSHHSCDASSECLVRETTPTLSSSSTSSTHRSSKDISTILPCILVWCMCISLSIPQFTLVSTTESYVSNNETNTEIEKVTCHLMDLHFAKMLISLLFVFRALIPGCLLGISWCLLVAKLVYNLRNDSIPSIFTKKCHNVVYYIIFCLALNFLYALTSLHRLIFYAMHAYAPVKGADVKMYLHPPLYNQFIGPWSVLSLCLLHYSGTFLRFLIYVSLLPKFKSVLLNNVLMCFKRKDT